MSLEILGLIALGLVLAFFVWREMRRSAPPETTKKLRALKKRVDQLEASVSSVPDEAFFAEIEKKLEFSTPVKVSHVVDRANQLSADMTELKDRFQKHEARLKSVEFMLKMKGIVSGGGPGDVG